MKKIVILVFLAIVAFLGSCQKNSEIAEEKTTIFVVLVGDNDPEKIVYLDNFYGEGPHVVKITAQQWAVVEGSQEIYISWSKFSKDELIYVDDGFIDIVREDDYVIIP